MSWLLKTPEDRRFHEFCNLRSLNDGEPLEADRVGKIVLKIGKAAGVVVDPRSKKTASAHDLRRSFGTRWSSKVRAADLQQLMRHESIETTLRYYISQDSDEIAERLANVYKQK